MDHNAHVNKNNQWKQLSCDQSSDKRGMIYQQHMISITAHKVSSLNDKKNKKMRNLCLQLICDLQPFNLLTLKNILAHEIKILFLFGSHQCCSCKYLFKYQILWIM